MLKYSFLQEVQEGKMPMWHPSCGGLIHPTILEMHNQINIVPPWHGKNIGTRDNGIPYEA